MDSILVDKRTASAMLSVSLRTVENLICAKRLEVRRIGSRTLVVRRSLEKLARSDVPNPTALAKAARSHGREGR